MNFLNSIQSKLHGAINPNSVQYIKQQDLQVQLDPSGTAYVDHGNQSISLNVDDENTTALAILNKTPSTQPLSLNSQNQFTICLKHKVQDQNKPLIGQYYTNPQYDLSISSTTVGTLDTFQVNAYKASEGPISYSITGSLTSADLSNADLTGTLTNLHTPLSYTLRSGYGDFVFSLDGLSQQVSATMYKKYWVKSVTNLLGDLVFGFSSTGSGGDYLNQPDLSFGAGGKYMFDVTDNTMTDISLVFGTTVDNLSTVNDSVVTRTNDLVIVDISAGYDGERLVYFEDTSAGMGYVSASSAGGSLKNYTVDVSNNSIFRLDSGDGNGFDEKPAIDFANNSGTTYVFDQSHESNANNTLVIGTVPDISSSIVSSGLTIMGTPGQAGAYTKYVSTGSTVYYFSYQTDNMGEEPPMYTVRAIENEVTGEKVFSIKAPGTSTFINQPDLSFGAGDKYQFNVLDPTMADISLVFGTTVDDSTSINESVVTRVSGSVILDISAGYTGNRLVYFEETSAGMGYAPASSFHQTPTTDVPVSREPYSNPSRSFKVLDYNVDVDTTFNTTFALENTQLILDFINDNYDGNELTVESETTSTFKESQRVYYMHNNTIYYMFLMWFNAPWIHPAPNDNYYSIISEKNTDLEANYPEAWGPRDYWLSDYGTGSGTTTHQGERHDYGTNVGNEKTHNLVDYASIGIQTSGNITVYYGDPFIPLSNVEYTITVVGRVFYVDGSPTPTLSLINGLNYVFDQSHESNTGNTLVIGTAPDISSSIVSSGLTIMGTPGQPGAYTHYVSDGSTVYYFSYQTENMGEEPPMYTVKVVDHEITGEKVFSFKAPGSSTFINQPDLSFGAGDRYQFDVTDNTMTDFSLVFGTTVDDSTSINESVVTRVSGSVILDLTDYAGDRLVYFEDTSAGMGYYFDSGSSSLSSTLYKNTEALTPAIGTTISIMEPATDVSNLTITLVDNIEYPFANGDYTITLSSRYNNSAVYSTVTTLAAILDEDDPTESFPWSENMYWEFRWPSYTQGTYGIPTEGSPTTTASNGISYTGEYIQLVMPYKTTLESTNLMTRKPNTTYKPNEIVLLGKNSGSSTFDYIGTKSNIYSELSGTQKTFTFNSTTPYDTYRIVVTQADRYVQMGIWSITGYPMIPSVPETYTVTVDGNPVAFYLDNESGPTPKPAIDFANNSGTTYIFDQSHESNANNTLVIGTAFDDPASIVSYGLTIMGTPGQPGAYTKYVSDGYTVHYFSYQTENMGLAPPNITDDLYVHYDFELPLYDANGSAYSTDVTVGSNGFNDQSIRFYNKAYDSSTNSDISYNMYVIRGNLVSDTFKIGSSSFKTFESPDKYGASRVDDYSFRLNSTQGYSICFWMKEVAKNFDRFLPLCAFGNHINGGGFFQMEYNDSTFKVNNNGTNITYSISSLPITNWNHIAFTMSPDGLTWKLYINGSLVNTKIDGTLLTSVSQENSNYPTDSVFIFDINAKPGDGGNNGFIDDFRFYKTELTQAQVSAVYSYTG